MQDLRGNPPLSLHLRVFSDEAKGAVRNPPSQPADPVPVGQNTA